MIGGGGSISGEVIFREVYKYGKADKWNDWAVVIGWVAMIRVVHYMVLVFVNRHFGRSQSDKGTAAIVQEDDEDANNVAAVAPMVVNRGVANGITVVNGHGRGRASEVDVDATAAFDLRSVRTDTSSVVVTAI